MTQHNTSSASSEQRNYINVSEIQTELPGALPRGSSGWYRYWDSYAQEAVELSSTNGHQYCGMRGLNDTALGKDKCRTLPATDVSEDGCAMEARMKMQNIVCRGCGAILTAGEHRKGQLCRGCDDE